MASVSTPINFYFHDAGAARTIRRVMPERLQRVDGAGGESLQFPGTPLRQEPAREPGLPEAHSAPLLEEFPPMTAVGEVGDSQRGLEMMGDYTSGNDKMHMCLCLRVPRRPISRRPSMSQEAIEDFAAAAPDGWVCLGLLQPRCHAPCQPLGITGRRSGRLRQAACVTADDDARFGLSLSGRGTGAHRSRTCLRGSAVDPYGIQFWPQFKGRDGCRTPMVWHSQVAPGRLLHRHAPGCRSRPST